MSSAGSAATLTPGVDEPGPDPRDPRPIVGRQGDVHVVEGGRCVECRYPAIRVLLRCALCAGRMEPDQFGPGGTVFSATVLRVPVPGRTPPYGLAYVDLDDGPRILAHVIDADSPLPVGGRVTLVGSSADGDPLVAAAGTASAPSTGVPDREPGR